MSTDVLPYTALKTIVAMALDEETKSFADFDKCWVFAFRGLVHMHYQTMAQPKTLRVVLEGNKTAIFPVDCLTVHKVGLINNNGELETLYVNNNLTTYKDTRVDRIENLTADVTDEINSNNSVPFYNFYNGGHCYNLWGLRRGVVTHGDCRIDEENRIILLDPQFSYDAVMVEYLPSPQRDDDYQVPTYYMEAIIAFVRWKLKLAPAQEFYGAWTAARRCQPNKKINLTKFNQTFRESTGMKLRS